MLTAPRNLLESLIPWQPNQVACPFGSLVSAVCPAPVPSPVLETLHLDEVQYASNLDVTRRLEWIAGRFCLAHALELPRSRMPLLPEPSGAPRVPQGYAGSISHKGPLTAGLATAGVLGIGIDLEYAEERDDRLAARVLTDGERSRNLISNVVVALHFAIKEAIFKALPADDQVELDFHDIELDFARTDQDWNPIDVQLRGQRLSGLDAIALVRGAWIIAAARRGFSAA